MTPSIPVRRSAFALLFILASFACTSSGGPTSATGPDPSAPAPEPESPSEPISLSTTALSFDSGVAEHFVRLQNPGPSTPAWRAESDAGWLTTSPSTGRLSVGENMVRIAVTRDDLEPGTHRATLRFVIGETALRVDVTVEIPARPEALLEPDRLDLGSEASGTATIENVGDGPLTWSISGPAWLAVTPDSGELPAGETLEIAVDPDRDALSPGVHEATLALASDGGEDAILVRVEVLEPARLVVEPEVLDFGSDRNAIVLSLENRGGRTLTWEGSPDRPWATIDAPSGAIAPGTTVTRIIAVDRTPLDPGHHTATLPISSDGGALAVPIEVDVDSGPASPGPSTPPPSNDNPGDDGSGDDPSGGDPPPEDPPTEIALSGRILGQFDGAALGGLTISFGGQAATTAADGTFQVPGTPSSSLRTLAISGSAVVNRETFARDGDGTWQAIPSTFDMGAFDDIARDFEPRTIRWTSSPRIYVDTRPIGFGAGPELDAWVQEVAGAANSFAAAWSDGAIPLADVQVGTSPPLDGFGNPELGWIVVQFSEDPSDYPSPGTVGVARTFWGPDRSVLAATIALRFGEFGGPEHLDVRRAVFGHEVGHTFGFGHMDGGTASLMTPSITQNDLTAFDRRSGSIVYSRSPGNRDPDRDDATFFRGGLAPSAAPTGSHGWVCGDPDLPTGIRGR